MTLQDLTEAKTDNLLLIVGSNPLPNYVAIKLLAGPGTRVHLVVTKPIKDAKVDELLANSADLPNDWRDFRIEATSPDALAELIERRVRAVPGSWGLNFTGGKKIMGFDARDGLLRAVKNTDRKVVTSYLDAESFELVVDWPQQAKRSRYSARQAHAAISLENLLRMHGHPWKETPQTLPLAPSIARELANMTQDANGWKIWKDWKKELPDPPSPDNPHRKNGKWQSCPLLDDGLPAIGSLTIASKSARDLANDWHADLADVVEWLRSAWLENYILNALIAIRGDCGLDEPMRSIKPQLSPSSDFEIDVAVMKGYQLLAVSATLDTSPKASKLKLLEVVARAQQMGGDEARTALVSLVEDPEIVQRQVAGLWLNPRQVQVWGLKDLPDLQEKLNDWIDHA